MGMGTSRKPAVKPAAKPMPRRPKPSYSTPKPLIRVPKLDPLGDLRKGVPELIEQGKVAVRRIKEGVERIRRAVR